MPPAAYYETHTDTIPAAVIFNINAILTLTLGAKGHRLPECLVCNRQQWAREGPGARKITSIALRRSTGGSSAS